MIPTYLVALLSLVNITTAATAASRTAYVSITGSKTGTNTQTKARPFRRNILDLQQDAPSWALYIQCLTTMQNVDENDPLSWFQIAGIHGRPYSTWNNVGPTQNPFYGGYCTHSSVLFTTWHRPYLALFEQVLAQCAQNVAKQYTGSNAATYQAAADKLRMPYWDWASDPKMPDSVSLASTQINTPNGLTTVRNPLFSYRFKRYPLNTSPFPPTSLSVFPQTVRSPITNTFDAVSDVGGINELLVSGGLMQRTYDTLTKGQGSYNGFSDGTTQGPSIENVHNNIHGYLGGNNGHMSFLDYSAFDPIFWLHHTNVDRLFAMWQAINPTSQMTPALEPGTYSLPRNNLDTLQTPLYPFTSTIAGQLYTSASALMTAKFNYAYPEIEDWNQSVDQLKTNVTAQINRLYDPNGIWQNTRPLRAAKRTALKAGAVTRAWSVAVKVAKFDLDGEMFRIRLFLGDIPAESKAWGLCKTLFGTMTIMPEPFDGPKPFPNTTVHDEWSLTNSIIAAGIDHTKTEDVVEYLKKNLDWRVQKRDNSIGDLKALETLQVSVFDQTFELPSEVTDLPKYGQEHNYHVEVTKDKPCGRTNSDA